MKTQTEAYWETEFEITDADVEFLYSYFGEHGSPCTVDELAVALVDRHYHLEKKRLAQEVERGPLYRPRERYQIGQELVFSAFDYTVGKVVAVRPGRNPQYGPFEVIRVELEGGRGAREFASAFIPSHPLNYVQGFVPESERGELSAEQIYALYQGPIRSKVEAALEADEEIVRSDGKWFLRSLMPEVHVGHLNIAEAMIVMAQRPLTTRELLQEMDFAAGSRGPAQEFALEVALQGDERFDSIMVGGEQKWFLYSLEPKAAIEVPWVLRPAYPLRRGLYLLGELIEFVKEIRDELDEVPESSAETLSPTEASLRAEVAKSVSFPLNYPHWREGTLPLTSQIRQFLPAGSGSRYPLIFVLDHGQRSVPGWVLLDHRYAWGLGEWYRQQGLPVGAYVTVSRAEEPFTLSVSYDRRPRRGEWVKEAKVIDGAISFEMQRRAYTCHYDRQLLLHPAEDPALDALRQKLANEKPPLADLMLVVIPELLKLSSQGVFHAKTLYAAVNVLRRTGAVPIFAELSRRACFDPVGAGNWTFDPELKDLVYGTEEEIRNRPHSRRRDLIRDIVLRY